MAWLEIFKTGTHQSMNGATLVFTDEILRQVAEGYNPAVHEAPLVIGHPETNDPAYGWVRAVRMRNSALEVDPHQLDEGFVAEVRKGSFKKISTSFYPPDNPANPTPGRWALRHVGFLGAATPAVKGLRPVAFAGQGTCCEYATPTPIREISVNLEELQAQLEAYKAREDALKKSEAAVEAARKAAIEQQATSFSEELARGGRLHPSDKQALVQVLVSLEQSPVVNFSEKQVSPAELLRDVLSRVKPLVQLGEAAPESAGAVVSFAAPAGYAVDPERLKLHAQVLAYQQANKVDYVTALKAVGGV